MQTLKPMVSGSQNGPLRTSDLARQAEKVQEFLEVTHERKVEIEPKGDWRTEKIACGADPATVIGAGLSEKALAAGAAAQARELDRLTMMRAAKGFASASTAFLNALRQDVQDRAAQSSVDLVL
ncbi:MAG: hypothetical protein ABJQ34_09835 [Paracoccaceae bacterium]